MIYIVDKVTPTNVIAHVGIGLQKGTTTGGVAVDGVLNLRSGEVSLFASPTVGQSAGRTATLDIGAGLGWNMKKNADYRGSFKAVGVQANIPLPSGTTLPLNASYFESTPSNPNGGSGFILGVTSGDTTGAVYGSYSDSVEVLNSASGMTIEGNNLATTFNNNAINAFFGDVVDFMFGAPNPAH